MTANSTQALYLTEPGDTAPISATDINQGGIGDCFLLAALAEEAYWNPALISNAIHDNGDGTQSVRLYTPGAVNASGHNTFTTTSVTVNDAALAGNAVNSNGQAMVNGIKEIWPQVIEAAYAQLNGGMAAIDQGGFPFYAMMQLVGASATAILDVSQVTSSMLRQDQAAGDLLVFDTGNGSLPSGLINNHAYFYKGLQTVNGKDYVLLGNPWGFAQPSPIAVSDLSAAFVMVDVGTVPAGAPPPVPAAPTPASTPTPAPTPTPTPATGLVVSVSEDAYLGDANFIVTIDGVQVGTYAATASHAAGQVQNITVANTLGAGSHSIGVTFVNDAYGGAPGLDRNLYVAGASYNGVAISGAAKPLYSNGTDAFGVTVGSPAPAAAGLVLQVAEDAYLGDAQFKVYVDGQQVGGTYSATASHAAGQSQAITVVSTLGSGSHQVGVSFINDAYGGSSNLDRNLYLTGASYNGQSIAGASAAFYGNSTNTFGVSVGSSAVTSTAVLNVSEDAYQGDAQFTVAIDGKSYGGTYSASASHGAGQSQAITISGIPESFSPHDLAVTFINDAYGGSSSMDRNLYVNSVQIDGQTIAGSAASLFGNSTVHIAMMAPPGYAG